MNNNSKFEFLKPFKAVTPFFRKNKRKIIIGSIFVLLNSATSILSPYVLKITIDDLQFHITIKKLAMYSSLIILITLIHGIFRYKMRKILITLSRVFEYEIHNQLYEHILRLPQKFFNITHTGDIMSKITNDVHAVRMVIGPSFMYMLNTIFTSLFAIIMMLSISTSLTLITLIPLPIISFSIAKIGKQIRSHFSKVQQAFSSMSIKAQENINGIREVKTFSREECEINEFNKISEEYLFHNKNLIKIYSIMHPLFFLLISLSGLLILFIGGKYVIDKKITLGAFVAFYSYLFLLAWPAIAVGWVINLIQRGSASMKRINELLEQMPIDKYKSNGTPVNLNYKSSEILLQINNLSFKYDEQPILKNINMQFPAYQFIAITGPTASGKSTILKQILRRYEIQTGSILFNNLPIDKIPIHDWLELIGYVPQDPFLFSDSIENNILLSCGDKNISEDFIIECLKIACIDSEISKMPQGIKTIIGERGITLSGGQKQRLSLARALAKKPLILLLDDPFSQVDVDTEYRIWEQLYNLNFAPIKIIISQRIHSIKMADKIYLLDNGSIKEEGTHESLLALNGIYSQLYQKQIIEQKIKTA
jgi:ATP-binding cassette subfamily B protein